jgi:dihydrofolate reductase
MKLAHIVAASENNVIGVNNTLPWDIPEDMKFFRDKTKGKALIMGRKTFESVGHPLPKRLNVVITRQPGFSSPHENVVVVPDLQSAIKHCEKVQHIYGDEVFIIGGGEIFKQSLPIVDVIYLTRIHQKFDGDIFYPDIPKGMFAEVERRERTEPIPFTFLTYTKVSN